MLVGMLRRWEVGPPRLLRSPGLVSLLKRSVLGPPELLALLGRLLLGWQR